MTARLRKKIAARAFAPRPRDGDTARWQRIVAWLDRHPKWWPSEAHVTRGMVRWLRRVRRRTPTDRSATGH